jgi:hypothetical protein
MRVSMAVVNHYRGIFKGAITTGGRVLAKDSQDSKKSGLGGFVFIGCILIGLGFGLAFGLMPGALIIGVGVGFLGMGIVRYKTGGW